MKVRTHIDAGANINDHGALIRVARNARTVRERILWLVAVASVLVMLGAPPRASAFDYQKVLVAATGDFLGGKILRLVAHPSLNNGGQVAFYVQFTDGGSGMALWDGGSAKLLVASGQQIGENKVLGVYCQPSMNDGGDVAFAGDFQGPRGRFSAVVRSSDGNLQLLVRTDQPLKGLLLSRLGCPSLNGLGEVAFRGWFGTTSGIFTASQGDLYVAILSQNNVQASNDIAYGNGTPLLDDGRDQGTSSHEGTITTINVCKDRDPKEDLILRYSIDKLVQTKAIAADSTKIRVRGTLKGVDGAAGKAFVGATDIKIVKQ